MTIETSSMIIITQANKRKLERIIRETPLAGVAEEGLAILKTKIDQAQVIGATVPRNCVTMGSTVSIIDIKTSEKLKFSLVYPEQASFEKGRVSVLSPLGASILGHQVGDEPEWDAREEIGHFVIAKVDSQPEARRSRSK